MNIEKKMKKQTLSIFNFKLQREEDYHQYQKNPKHLSRHGSNSTILIQFVNPCEGATYGTKFISIYS